MQRNAKKLLLLVLLLTIVLSGCEEEHVDAPGTLQYNGIWYSCTGGFVDSSAIRKEFIGEVNSQVPGYEFPQQDFESNMDGIMGGKMYLLDDGDIIVEYDGEAYGDWTRFSKKEPVME